MVRAAVAEALTDQRPLLPVFIFDPRFLDRALGSIWTHRVFMDVYGGFMTHALRNYSRVSTRLWNNFFWNNFQGIIFEGGRYTIMHVGI